MMHQQICRVLRLALALALLGVPWPAAAADQWIEVKSAHFTVVSNAGDRATRKLVWQLEQVRSATSAMFSWARPDLNKPLAVIVLKDENSMRALAPKFWEERRAVKPASVWVTGPDRHYLALRTDVETESQGTSNLTTNPYITAYFSYINLVLNQSLDRDLPLWFTRGLTGVLSNTIVNDDHVLLGAPIAWNLQLLRERPIYPLPRLLAFTHTSPETNDATPREVYDAETWAFVHFLMFGDEGKRSGQLNEFSKQVSTGKDVAAAFAETLGPVAALDSAFRTYMQRPIYSFRRLNIDVSVEREKWPVRTLTAAEAASMRARFHAAMRRPVEARAAIAEARKADPNAADSFVAEGLIADQEDKNAEAKAAYGKAAELNTTSAFAYYRLASLTWQPSPSQETLGQIEKQLELAVKYNTRYAAAYAWLGEVRAFLGQTDSIGLVRRAIQLEPIEPAHRLRAAIVSLRVGKPAEARADAEAALALADTDAERREAAQVLEAARKAEASMAGRPAAAASSSVPAPTAAAGAVRVEPPGDVNVLNTACQSGDNGACAKLLPFIEGECAQKNGTACGFAAFLHERGRGVAANTASAASFYNQACDAGEKMGCIGFALLQARGDGVAQDEVKARATLNQLCSDGAQEACVQLAVLVAKGRTAADLARARDLLTKACDAKHERACQMLKSLPK